ncbi:hypothetical protein MBLNU459_g2897t2 [Dothideomycetes sp. NU459]
MACRSAIRQLGRCPQTALRRTPACCLRRYASSSSNSEAPTNKTKDAPSPAAQPSPSSPPKEKKTVAELDEELRQKMAGMSGDGGESGVEYEDGQPVSMKRGVKNNMFRYI